MWCKHHSLELIVYIIRYRLTLLFYFFLLKKKTCDINDIIYLYTFLRNKSKWIGSLAKTDVITDRIQAQLKCWPHWRQTNSHWNCFVCSGNGNNGCDDDDDDDGDNVPYYSWEHTDTTATTWKHIKTITEQTVLEERAIDGEKKRERE